MTALKKDLSDLQALPSMTGGVKDPEGPVPAKSLQLLGDRSLKLAMMPMYFEKRMAFRDCLFKLVPP